MRVTNQGPQGVPEPYRQGSAGKVGVRGGAGNGGTAGDRIELSPEAQLIQRLQRESGVSPERTARLEAIRQAVDSGQYRVPASRIAQRMLEKGFHKP